MLASSASFLEFDKTMNASIAVAVLATSNGFQTSWKKPLSYSPCSSSRA